MIMARDSGGTSSHSLKADINCVRVSFPGCASRYSYGPSKIFSFSCDQELFPWKAMSFDWYFEESASRPGGLAGFIVLETVAEAEREEDFCLWLIQSPSGTGRKTGFEAMWLSMLMPVEEVRGGMALGDRKFSEAIVKGPLCKVFPCDMWQVPGSLGKSRS